MRNSRLFLPLFFVFSLLFAQQIGAVHTLKHALEELSQQDKHAPNPSACEKCDNYTQLGSALNVSALNFALRQFSHTPTPQFSSSFNSAKTLTAAARGPPARPQKIA